MTSERPGYWEELERPGPDTVTVAGVELRRRSRVRLKPRTRGDLFDGGEIDGMLVLNILSLTDEEKAEMRDSDPRAREILERTEALSEEQLMSLHGAVREFGMARGR